MQNLDAVQAEQKHLESSKIESQCMGMNKWWIKK